MASFLCSHCGASITHNPALVGKRAKCPKCQQPILVPELAAPATALKPTSVHPPALPPPITPVHAPAPQPTVVVVGNQQPRLESGGWFARAFTTTSGIIIAMVVFALAIVGIPVLVVCGGCLYMAGEVGQSIEEVSKKRQQDVAANSPKPLVAPAATDAPSSETGDAAPAPAPPAVAVETWHPHDQPLATPDVVLRIGEVRIGKVPLKNFSGEGTSEDPLLWLRVHVENRSETKKLEFARWNTSRSSFSDFATLEDELGNSYKRINFGFGTTVAGLEPRDSIYPGKSAEAVLVFEVPIDAAKTLRLTMPASAVEGKGDFRFGIPTTAIQRE